MDLFGAIVLVCLLLIVFNYKLILNKIIEILGPINYNARLRIESLLDFFSGESATGDLLDRSSRYSMSTNSFASNPLLSSCFGLFGGSGGHSEILDLLAFSCLFGLIVSVVIARKYYVNFLRNRVDKDVFLFGGYLTPLAIAIFNTFSAPSLFLFLFLSFSPIRLLKSMLLF